MESHRRCRCLIPVSRTRLAAPQSVNVTTPFGEVRVGAPETRHMAIPRSSRRRPGAIGTNLNTDFHQRELRLERTGQSGRPAL